MILILFCSFFECWSFCSHFHRFCIFSVLILYGVVISYGHFSGVLGGMVSLSVTYPSAFLLHYYQGFFQSSLLFLSSLGALGLLESTLWRAGKALRTFRYLFNLVNRGFDLPRFNVIQIQCLPVNSRLHHIVNLDSPEVSPLEVWLSISTWAGLCKTLPDAVPPSQPCSKVGDMGACWTP